MDALIALFVTGLAGLFIGFLKKPGLSLTVSLLGMFTALALLLNYGNYESPFNHYDGLSFSKSQIYFAALAIVLAMMVIAGGSNYLGRDSEHTADYYGLLIFSLCGGLILIGFTNLFMFFLGLEIMSIPIYVLVGIKKQNKFSSEASLKYFFTGAFSTAILLFGIAMIFGAVGSFDLSEIQLKLSSTSASNLPMVYLGVLFIMASFLFKVGAVPFHFWGPDVYQGSPDVTLAFMATVVKLSGLYAFYQMYQTTFVELGSFWIGILYFSIIISLFLGYMSALKQSNFKRMLAYSSISNTGFALFALLNGNESSLWMFLLGYTVATIALMTVSQVLENNDAEDISSWKGIGAKNPFLGLVIVVSFLSLAGIPPLTGFFGKFMLLYGAYKEHLFLVIVALIASVIGAYLYLRFILQALSKESDSKVVQISTIHKVVLLLCLVGVLASWVIMFFV